MPVKNLHGPCFFKAEVYGAISLLFYCLTLHAKIFYLLSEWGRNKLRYFLFIKTPTLVTTWNLFKFVQKPLYVHTMGRILYENYEIVSRFRMQMAN